MHGDNLQHYFDQNTPHLRIQKSFASESGIWHFRIRKPEQGIGNPTNGIQFAENRHFKDQRSHQRRLT